MKNLNGATIRKESKDYLTRLDEKAKKALESSQKKVKDSERLEHLEKYDCIYDNNKGKFPKIIQAICDLFDQPHERDLALITAITIFGQILINVGFNSNNITRRTNLFVVVTAESGEGKSVSNTVIKLFSKLNKKISETAKHHFENLDSTSKNENSDQDTDTIFKGLFLPEETSSAGLYQTLEETKGLGFVFSSETDTTTRFKSSDNSTDAITRKGAEGEGISKRLSGDKQNGKLFTVINNIYLSQFLTGTLNQTKRLINNVEEGMFSRYLYWNLPVNDEFISNLGNWNDQKIYDKKVKDIKNVIDEIGEKSKYSQNYKGDLPVFLKFAFTEKLIELFTKEWGETQNEYIMNVSRSMKGLVRRSAIGTWRIAAIIDGLFHLESNKYFDGQIINFSESSYEIASLIVHRSAENSAIILKELKNDSHSDVQESGFIKGNKHTERKNAKIAKLKDIMSEDPYDPRKIWAKKMGMTDEALGKFMCKYEIRRV